MSDNNEKVKTKIFSRDFLYDNVLYTPKNIVVEEVTSTSRWSVVYYLVFKHEGKFYQTTYSRGATEVQDESPWEYENQVECVEVEPYTKTVVDYKPVTE